MEKTITIDGKKVAFKATASTTRRYRQLFGRDLILDMQALSEASVKGELSASNLEAFENIAFTMAKQADDSIPDDADEWLDGFSMFSIYQILPQLIELWGLNQKTLSKSKKK